MRGAAFGAYTVRPALSNEPKILDSHDLGNREAIVNLGELDVFGPEPAILYAFSAAADGRQNGDVFLPVERDVIGCLRDAEHPHGLVRESRARSSGASTTDAAPSLTSEQSYSVSGSATGLPSIACSIVITFLI